MPIPTNLDIENRHLVGVRGTKIVIVSPPGPLSPDEALVFAAWIVALAEHSTPLDFQSVLHQVQNT